MWTDNNSATKSETAMSEVYVGEVQKGIFETWSSASLSRLSITNNLPEKDWIVSDLTLYGDCCEAIPTMGSGSEARTNSKVAPVRPYS